jgi:hypothetical protein
MSHNLTRYCYWKYLKISTNSEDVLAIFTLLIGPKSWWREKKCFRRLTCIMLRKFYYAYSTGWVIDQYRKFPRSKAIVFRSILDLRQYSSRDFSQLLGSVSYVFIITVVDEKFPYEWSWSVAETEKKDDRVLESSEAESRCLRRAQRAGGHHVVHFTSPDYSKIPSKVDSWPREP